MNHKKLKLMEKQNQNNVDGMELQLPTYLEIELGNDGLQLEELKNNKAFCFFIIENVFKKIKFAIENNLDTLKIFSIFNLSIMIELDKSQFKNVLNHIVKVYAEQDDFETCIEIKDLIDEI